MNELIYLDYAAATPLEPKVYAAMEPYLFERFYNPSSAYQPARDVRRDFEDARGRLARIIGAKPDEIIMTAGATESVNIAFQGALAGGGHVVTAAIEHQAVLASARQYNHTLVEATPKGVVLPESIRAAITDDTRLVSIAMANSEIGTVQPLRDIAQVIHGVRQDRYKRGIKTPIYFHSDASQAAGLLELQVARLGLDMLTLNAAKCYGPKQVGLLWAASHVRLQPLIHGGGQERGIRSGTENVAGTIGFARALEIAEHKRKGEVKRLSQLRDVLENKILEAFPDVEITGHRKHRLPGHSHMAWRGLDAERALFALEMKGVLVATGSACAANKGTRSHVLTALQLPPELADGSLRFSLGRQTDEAAVKKAATAIIEVVRQELSR
ncbi:MAG TPA: cysteine desulfurase family protein [Verrucomicrobiae bacterium]|nr:cysteine desulfurase family protein [Verrucomicrobiae bacterium]